MDQTEVLYLGMGSPAELADIRRYLFTIFKDKHILPLPGVFRYALAWWISTTRASSSRAKYERIGGGSPYREQTRKQVEALAEALAKQQQNIPVRAAFSYADPMIAQAVKEAADRGVKRIIGLPQYPHFSTTTTASCFEKLERECGRYGIAAETITAFPKLDGFVQAWQDSLTETIHKVDPAADGTSKKTHVFFLAHSIPLSCVEKGDPYPGHVEQTVNAVAACLESSSDWSVAYQSPAGRGKWLQPEADEAVREALKHGVKNVVVVPVSFLTENLETCYDLDVCLAELMREEGVGDEKLLRVPVPYCADPLIDGFAELIAERL